MRFSISLAVFAAVVIGTFHMVTVSAAPHSSRATAAELEASFRTTELPRTPKGEVDWENIYSTLQGSKVANPEGYYYAITDVKAWNNGVPANRDQRYIHASLQHGKQLPGYSSDPVPDFFKSYFDKPRPEA
ncbi:hypothetical protein BC835DRAFT_1023161 [Cytidiella melzeri]|nr:hypothetical protein BC835DRAFT_1023161 [Cytidiella melzeri]